MKANQGMRPLDNSPEYIGSAYEWAIAPLTQAGIDSPRYEAQLLLAMTLGVGRATVIAGTHAPLTPDQGRLFADLVAKRADRVPLAYLRGTQEFYGREYRVTPAVLVPRPETELLVEQALVRMDTTNDTASPCLIDVGTGTGCIPVSLLAERPHWVGMGVDISSEALSVALTNIQRNEVSDRLRLIRAHLLACVASRSLHLVVSNPPYISHDEIAGLQPEVAMHEPRLALDGGVDGLDFYRALVGEGRRVLRSQGWLCFEVGMGQAGTVSALFLRAGYDRVSIHKDFAGIERVVCGQKK